MALGCMQAKLRGFTAAAPLQLRTCLACHSHVPLLHVNIEGTKSGNSACHSVQPAAVSQTGDSTCNGSQHPTQATCPAMDNGMTRPAVGTALTGVTVAAHIQLGGGQALGDGLVAALKTAPETVLQNDDLFAVIGVADRDTLHAQVVNVTANWMREPTLQSRGTYPSGCKLQF